MARRSTSRAMVLRPSTPTIRLVAPRQSNVVRMPRRHARRSSKRHVPVDLTTAAIAGVALSLVPKLGLPAIPVVGTHGATAIVAYFLSKQGGQLGAIARTVCTVSIALCAQDLMSGGKVLGEDFDTV